MQELTEVILSPRGGLNSDDSQVSPPLGAEGRSLFELGDYTYMRNMNNGSSIENNTGGSETVAGTTEVSIYKTWDGAAWITATYPSTGTLRGHYKDVATGRVFMFWESTIDRIEMYVKAERTTYLLLESSILNFGTFVKAALINNWLALTDRTNRPRLIDINTIHQTAFTLGSNFREFHISFIKWAPTVPPLPRINYDGVTNNWTKLSNKVFQFTHMYVYKGRLKSRWGPVSKAAYVKDANSVFSNYYANKVITSIQVEIRGSILDTPGAATEYNYFDHDSIKFTEAVEYIQLAYREGERSPWRLWKRVYESGGAFEAYHDFDGQVDGRIIPISEFNEQFDSVPILAGTVEAIDNRFVFGDCLTEHEPVTDFSIEDVASVKDTLSQGWYYADPASSFPLISATPREKLLKLNALSQFNLKDRGLYKAAIMYGDHTGWRSLSYTTDNWTYELPVSSQFGVHAMKFRIPDSVIPPEWATCYQILRSNTININSFMRGIANQFVPLLDSATTLIGASGLPQNIKDKLAQHFENSNIVDGYQVAEEIDKARQGTSEIINTGLVGSLAAFAKRKAQIGINVFRDKSKLKYLEFNKLRFKIGPEIRVSTSTAIAVTNASRIYIDINNWYNAARESVTKNRLLSKLFYNFREGDRVRFWGSEVAVPASVSELKLYDLEILEFTGAGIIVEKPEGLLSLPTGDLAPWGQSYDIEVYTPNDIPDENNFLFHECGEWYPVLYPGTGSRNFSKRDWGYIDNASVTLSQYGPFDIFHKMPLFYGDCFQVQKIVYRDLSLQAEGVGTSMNPHVEKTWDFWEQNNGRPSIAYLDLPVAEFIETQAKFGGKLVQDSFVNQINRFDDENQFIYPSEYGRIRALVNISHAQVESVGNILLAIGENETWSIYVNRTVLEDLSGRQQVALSNRVLGSFNTLLGSHGTTNPESISLERGRLIYWDQKAGSWIRYAQDGLTEISTKYKMKNWFKDLSIIIAGINQASETQVNIISTWDNYHERWIMSMEHADLPATFKGYSVYKCISFQEDTPVGPRWKEFFDYVAEGFDSIDNEVYSLVAGKVHIHEDDEDNFSTFYGVKKDCEIELIANQSSRKMKVWQSQGHIASDKWSSPSIKGDWKSNGGTVQETSIALADLSTKEDMYWADLMRDQNTPNRTGDDARVNGNPMRSKVLKVRLKLDPSVTFLSVFNWLVLYNTPSEKTTKT